jgi:hypothetical protein
MRRKSAFCFEKKKKKKKEKKKKKKKNVKKGQKMPFFIVKKSPNSRTAAVPRLNVRLVLLVAVATRRTACF